MQSVASAELLVISSAVDEGNLQWTHPIDPVTLFVNKLKLNNGGMNRIVM